MVESTERNLYVDDAHLYDLDNRDIVKVDIPFYIEYANKIKGKILELACGTGRLTIPLAKAGHEIWGVELSNQMLEQFENKLKGLPKEITDKIHLTHGNMSNFNIDRKFSLIIIPNRSFQLLYDPAHENKCLRSVFHYLKEDGHFIIDIGNFVGDKEKEWVSEEEIFDWENVDPQTGNKVRRTHIKKEIDINKQIIYPQKNYYIMKGDILLKKIIKRSPWKYFSADQVRTLLTSNGFKIDKELGSYDGKPINDGTEFIFICRKK